MIIRRTIGKEELSELPKAAFPGNIHIVDTPEEADKAARYLKGQPILGIDTEKNLKVGGEGEDIGVTITRVDGSEGTSYFFPVNKLFPNTKTQVGFVLPADAPEGSVWSVKICTQLSSNGSNLLKSSRTVIMDTNFVVGEEATDVPSGGGGDDSGQGTFG